MPRYLCLKCRNIAALDEGEEIDACPSCHDSKGIPADADDTITVTLTTHELRILTMWADNWAQHAATYRPENAVLPKIIRGILDHLAQYTSAPLSISQEMADLRKAFPDAEVTVFRDGERTEE